MEDDEGAGYVEQLVVCPHCNTKQNIRVYLSSGFGEMKPVICAHCKRVFEEILPPGEIIYADVATGAFAKGKMPS